ncbi:hypothetical protein [Puniceibacterium confluentis]
MTDITEQQVKDAPEHRDNWHGDRDWEKRAHNHYGAPMYWL